MLATRSSNRRRKAWFREKALPWWVTARVVLRGSDEPWLCSWSVSIAEVDKRRMAQIAASSEELVAYELCLALLAN